jgi:NAD(P)-dependent dehydrogenase (short-subunit alcohol dehydrogenase family)
MIKRDYGRIVNISSGWGSFSDGLTGPFSYSYSKACLNAFTVTAAKNLPKNIKINSMCPGWVKTRMGGDTAPRTPEQGAETAIWLANADEDSATGQFFRDKKMIPW